MWRSVTALTTHMQVSAEHVYRKGRRPRDRDRTGAPGNGAVLGIIVGAAAGTIQNFDQKVDVSQWNISTMMTWLNFERALIESEI